MSTPNREQGTAPVVIPDSPGMANEPARTIGNIFADKVMMQTVVSAVIGILAVLGFNVAEGVSDQIVTLIGFVALIVTTMIAQNEARQRAKAQAAQTRDVVYSPASAKAIASDAVPPADWGVHRADDSRG